MSFPEQPFGFVAGRWVRSIGDTPDDPDRAPDYVPVENAKIVFTPQITHRVAADGSGWAGIIKDRVTAGVGERGQLIDAEGHDHLALAVGVYSVSYDFGLDKSWPSHMIEVKQEHTSDAPLWLPPIAPPSEGPRIETRVVTIPADGADGQVLVWDGGGFSWEDSPPGLRGPEGPPGPQGDPGRDGKDGEPGKDGAPGKDGRDGEPGPKGDPGEPGKDGEPGPKGDPGEPGKDGEPGPKGDPGEPGKDGAPGKDGKDGAPGKDGEPGRDGKDGEPGKAATVRVGTVNTRLPGTTAIVENVGTETDAVLKFTIPRGDKGEKGDPGRDGEPGPKGDPGSDATIVNQRTNAPLRFWVGTQAQYDAIWMKDPNTVYHTT